MKSTPRVLSQANAMGGKLWSRNLTTRELIGLYENGYGVTVTVYLENEGFHQISIVNIDYDLIGRPTKIYTHDTNFPTKLAKTKVCDFDAMRATPSMRAPSLEPTELPNGTTVPTLQMRTLGHPTADISHYDAGR
jgi:hypothetical protein